MEDLIILKKLGYELNENERIVLPEDINESRENQKKSEPKFEEIEIKLKEIEYRPMKKLSRLPWIETLCINDPGTDDLEIDINQDKKREEYFYKIAARCTALGLTKLKTMGIDFSRPHDYFTEMLKSDKFMRKIRSRMVSKLNSNSHNHNKKSDRKSKRGKNVRGKDKSSDNDGEKSKKSSNLLMGRKRKYNSDNSNDKGDRSKKFKVKDVKFKDGRDRKGTKSPHKDKDRQKRQSTFKNKRDK